MIQNISDNIAIDMELIDVSGSLKRKDKFIKRIGILSPQASLVVNLENEFMEEKDMIEMVILCKDIYGNKRFYNVKGEYNFEEQIYFFAVYR